MMRCQFPIVMLVLFSAGQLAAQTPNERTAPDEKLRMQGIWQPIRLERKGEFVEDSFRPTARIVVANDTVLFQVDGKTLVHLRFQIEPGRSPKQIDFTCTSGPAKGQVLRGIYSFTGDRLTLCWPLDPAAPRPVIFLDAPDKDHATLTLERSSVR